MSRTLVSQIKDNKFNWIINSDFKISQRGDYSSNTAIGSIYYLDRWKGRITGSLHGVFRRLVDLPSGVPGVYACFVQATDSATAILAKRQILENSGLFGGKTVTFSCWVRSNSSNTRLIISDGVANYVSSAHSGNGNYEHLKITATINTAVTTIEVSVGFFSATAGSTSITSGDYFTFTASQFVVGTDVGLWEPIPHDIELLRCYRFYYKSGLLQYSFQRANYDWCFGAGSFPVPMRIVPSIFPYLTEGITKVYGFTTGVVFTGVTINHITTDGFASVNKTNAFTTEETVLFGVEADAEMA